jgi:hypothetical protein
VPELGSKEKRRGALGIDESFGGCPIGVLPIIRQGRSNFVA